MTQNLDQCLRDWAFEERGASSDRFEEILQELKAVVPIELARRGSLKAYFGRSDGYFRFPRNVVCRDDILQMVDSLATHSFAYINGDCTSDLLLACACRTIPIFEDEVLGPALGFKGFQASRTPYYSQEWADENFDRLMQLHTIDTVRFLKLLGLEPEDVGVRYLRPDGTIPLFISTRERDPSRIGIRGNVGDNFGLSLLQRLTDIDLYPLGVSVETETPIVMTVGSILAHARDRALVWGSGAIVELSSQCNSKPTGSDFIGVRGPRTREQLLRRNGVNPAVIGDPGLLLPLVAGCPCVEADVEVGFVVHSADRGGFDSLYPDAFLINTHNTLDGFMKDLTRCKYIVSSSLHGIVFAHSLGKPALPIKLGNRLTGGSFKFRDYANSIGHYSSCYRWDLSSATRLQDEQWLHALREHPYSCDEATLRDLTSRLLATFPFPLKRAIVDVCA